MIIVQIELDSLVTDAAKQLLGGVLKIYQDIEGKPLKEIFLVM